LQSVRIETISWPHSCRELYRILSSGGCVEIIEPDLQIRDAGPIGQRFNKYAREVFAMQGKSPDAQVLHLPTWLNDVGFQKVERQIHQVKFREMDDRWRNWAENEIMQLADDVAGKIRELHHTSETEEQEALDGLLEEILEFDSRLDVYVFWGIKPRK